MYSGRFLMESMKIRFAKSETMHYIFLWLYHWTNERSIADWAIYKSSCKTYFQQSSALKRQIKADNVDADGIHPLDVFCLHSLSGIGVPRAELQQGASFFCPDFQENNSSTTKWKQEVNMFVFTEKELSQLHVDRGLVHFYFLSWYPRIGEASMHGEAATVDLWCAKDKRSVFLQV